jgi:hypothetical protein
MNAFGVTYYTVDSNKNVTSETKTASVTEIVNDAIDDLKESGELGSDDVLIVTSENGVASHSSTEIKAAFDSGKAVFLIYETIVYPITSFNGSNGYPVFDGTAVVPSIGYLGTTKLTVDADKKITSTGDSIRVSNIVDSAIEDLRQSGVLVEDVLAALPTWTGGSY